MTALNTAINIVIGAVDKASPEIDHTAKSLAALEKRSAMAQKAFKGLAVGGAAVGAALVAMTAGAREQVKTQALLTSAIENTGDAASDLLPQAEAVISKLQGLTGVSDELQRQALTNLVTVLGDTDKALAALPAVMDASSSAGTGLIETSRTMAKALAGQVHMAESVGLQFEKTADFGERLAAVNAKVGGAAEALSDPFSKMSASLADVSDAIGVALMPAFNAVADVIGSLARAFADADPIVHRVTATLGAVVAVLGGAAGLLVLVPSLTTAVGALGVALNLMMGPLGLVTLALGAAAGGLVWALTDTEDASDEVTASVIRLGDALGDEVPTASREASEAVSAFVGQLYDAQQVLDTTRESTSSIAAVFRDRFGEIPEDVEAALSLVDQTMGEQTGAFTTTFTNSVMGMQGEARRVFGEDMPADLKSAFEVVHRAWKEGPGAAFQLGVDEVDVALAKLDTSTQKTAAAVADNFGKVGEAMPEGLKGALNAMSSMLTGAVNDVFLGYVNKILAVMKDLDQNGLLGSQINVLDSLPDQFAPMDPLPTFRMGTRSFRGGRAGVNEGGLGEIITLPGGAGVMDAGSSTRLVEAIKQAGRGGGGGRSFSNYGTLQVIANNADDFYASLEDVL